MEFKGMYLKRLTGVQRGINVFKGILSDLKEFCQTPVLGLGVDFTFT